jgi:hypothetical protein
MKGHQVLSRILIWFDIVFLDVVYNMLLRTTFDKIWWKQLSYFMIHVVLNSWNDISPLHFLSVFWFVLLFCMTCHKKNMKNAIFSTLTIWWLHTCSCRYTGLIAIIKFFFFLNKLWQNNSPFNPLRHRLSSMKFYIPNFASREFVSIFCFKREQSVQPLFIKIALCGRLLFFAWLSTRISSYFTSYYFSRRKS